MRRKKMNDRFKFRTGFKISYYDDAGNDKEAQLEINGNFSVDCGGAGVCVHSDKIDEAIDDLDPTDHERRTIIDFLNTNYDCMNDYWLIDNIDYLDQCSGLKDKNGNLIYKGDIVKTEWFDEKEIYQVGWDEKMACFCFENNDFFYLFDDLPADVVEIVGNIHENPELLEKNND